MPNLLNKSNIKKANKHAKLGDKRFNCWGATLYALNFIDYLEWIDRGQMQDFLNKQTYGICENQIEEGDILVLYDEFEDLIHTAVYIGNKMFWHKLGDMEAEEEYLQDILDTYHEYNCIEYRRLA